MANSTDIISSLGAGSGVDIKQLAQNLADAEIQPRKDLINTKISQTEAKISAYGYIKTALSDLQNAFKLLDDAADFTSITPSISQPAALGVTAAISAQAGSYDLQINQVATAQRSNSNAFSSASAPLKAGVDFRLSVDIDGAQAVTVSDATPQSIVNAINGSNWGVSAQLLNAGGAATPAYTIILTGQTGQTNAFTINVTDASGNPILEDGSGDPVVQFSTIQEAANASFTLNGLEISRPTNQVNDLIDGVTLNLYSATSGVARLDLNRQTQSITDGFKNLVTAYNNLNLTLTELGNKDSTVEEVGGALQADSILQSIRSTVRNLITTGKYSAISDSTNTARSAGLSFDRYGKLTLDETQLANALQDNFDDVVTLFSAGTNGKSVFSPADAGIAGDAVVQIDKMLRSTGLIARQATTADKKILDYKDELTRLDERMNQILARYMQQFSVMETLVGNSKALQSSLKGSFDGMMAMYTNK